MKNYLVRERYLKKIRAGRDDTDVIKIITGMRRSGKSVLMELYIDELLNSGVKKEQIIHINFEDFKYQNIKSSERLNEILLEKIDQKNTTYIFLDEIQNISQWELTLSGLLVLGNCDT